MTSSTPTLATLTPPVSRAFLRYRVLAWTTGIWLLALTADVVAKYIFNVQNTPTFVAVVHGWIYFLYLIVTVDLAVKARWSKARTLGILLAGTVPFLSFVVERKVSHRVRAGQAI